MDPDYPTPPARVLVVMPGGAARREARAAFSNPAYEVVWAREPYEGTARFIEGRFDLVVVSLAGFRRRDLKFVELIRGRQTHTRVLLILPEGRRALAVAALEAGADAYVLEPFYRTELLAVAARLLIKEQVQGTSTAGLANLASEVAHAVNNPLQVLSLLSEENLEGQARTRVRGELDRVQVVTEILGRFGHRRAIERRPTAWSEVLDQPLAAFAEEGPLRIEGARSRPSQQADMDPNQMGQALSDVFETLGALADETPIGLVLEPDAQGITVRTAELQDQGPLLESLPGRVVWSHELTRKPLPGWALAAAVCGDHGGLLDVGISEREATIRLQVAP